MKKYLFIFSISFFIVSFAYNIFAQTALPINNSQSKQHKWVVDSEVTSIGKQAIISGLKLDANLRNYQWGLSQNLLPQLLQSVIFSLLLITVIITSVVIIAKIKKNSTTTLTTPDFFVVILMIIFSYSLVNILYQFSNIIQGFFLSHDFNNFCPPDCISNKDLFYLVWGDYKTFVGLKLLDSAYAQSISVQLFLVKFTFWGYNTINVLLIFRIIILWIFLIISPIIFLPLFKSLTSKFLKILICEFFRWLLYAPLLAISLQVNIVIWKNLFPFLLSNLHLGKIDALTFPTAINILMGVPSQTVSLAYNTNTPETFFLYIISVAMLWFAIFLPFIFLHIFLYYGPNLHLRENGIVKELINLLKVNGAASVQK